MAGSRRMSGVPPKPDVASTTSRLSTGAEPITNTTPQEIRLAGKFGVTAHLLADP